MVASRAWTYLGRDPGVNLVLARCDLGMITLDGPRATSVFTYQGVPGFDPGVTRVMCSGVTVAEPGMTLVSPSGNPVATRVPLPCLFRVTQATGNPE